MSEPRNQYRPTRVSAPGETLEDLLVERGLSRGELAGRLGCSTQEIRALIADHLALTPERALQLEAVFGTPASFWNRREEYYRASLAAHGDQEASLSPA